MRRLAVLAGQRPLTPTGSVLASRYTSGGQWQCSRLLPWLAPVVKEPTSLR